MVQKDQEGIIDEVFACRGFYNEDYYIKRNQYENDLKRKLKQYRFVFVTGESGSGKTWLTKHCFPEISSSDYINLSDVSLKGGLVDYMEKSMYEILTERESTHEIEGNLAVASGKYNSNEKYKVNTDILWEYLSYRENRVIILDNFESIINDLQIINDISCLITLADDPLMIEYNPKFIIIGALGDIFSFFQTLPNYQTIANRTAYVNIMGFNDTECLDYVSKGFRETGFTSPNINELSQYIYNITNGMPQAVSELCYHIAINHYDSKKTEIIAGSTCVYDANIKWVQNRMLPEYSVIRKYYLDNIHTNNDLLNFVLASIENFKDRAFSAEQMRSTAEEAMGDNISSLGLKKVQNFLDTISDDKENRNLLIKTEYSAYKSKTYKTTACLSIALDIKDSNVIFIDDLVV